MLKVISFGEALVDMLSSKIDHQSDSLESFTKYPGGAPANVAAAIGKLGGDSYMAGKIGRDNFGDFMRQSLTDAGVNTDYLLSTDQANTALAFVSLDNEGERSFTFYRNPSADMFFRSDEFEDNWFETPGIFHFSSNTLTAADIKEATFAGAHKAKEAGYLISFDVNLRANLWSANDDPSMPIWSGLNVADIVKVSQEEMDFLCENISEQQVIERLLNNGASLILITNAGKPLQYISHECSGTITPPRITMVDSTAAGDAFFGAFLYQLADNNYSRDNFSSLLHNKTALEQALVFASHCGAFAASHKGAFTSLPYLKDINI